MPRGAREKAESGIYHVMLRGINKQTIFEDDEDCEKFVHVVNDCKKKSCFKLMAYCLMSNHLHLLIKEEKEELGQIFRRIGSSYVYWYNSKYSRTGHLFQDRFRSESVNDEEYFLTVLRYIHQNPIKAGLCTDVSKYKWSSYNDYLYKTELTDIEFGLSLFSEDVHKAQALFEKYMNEEEKKSCLDYEQENRRITDNEAHIMSLKLCGVNSTSDFLKMPKGNRDICIGLLKDNGLSIRQISRITGIGAGIVRKIEHKGTVPLR